MGRHTPSAALKVRNNWVAIAAGLLVILLFGALVTRCASTNQTATRPGSGEDGQTQATASAECGPVRIATTVELAPVVSKQAKAITNNCHTYTVESIEPATFSTVLTSGKDVPDVWIPDSALWQESLSAQLPSSGVDTKLVPKAIIATSPAVIAVPKSLAKPTNVGVQPYLAALAQLPLAAAPPNDFTPTVLSYAAVWQELQNNPMARSMMGNAFFQVTRASLPPDALFDLAGKSEKEARAFPASEQQIFAYNQAHASAPLRAVTPASGPPMLQYQYVNVGSPAQGVVKGSEKLLKQLQGAKAQEALRKAGFRAGKMSAPLVNDIPVKLPGKTPAIDVASFDKLRVDWNRLSHDTKMLVAVDISGSMKHMAGNQTRAALASHAITEAVKQMPPTSEAGLWFFSTKQGGGGVPYRQMTAVGPLGQASNPNSRVNVITSAANRMPSQLQGDTGLYDTILAAYKEQVRNYDPSMESMVVVVTDGKNDNPDGGLNIDQLISQLKAAQDKNRPVRLVLIGMGPDTDVAAMRKITNAVGGQTTVATDPQQITGVFAKAVWSLAPNHWKNN